MPHASSARHPVKSGWSEKNVHAKTISRLLIVTSWYSIYTGSASLHMKLLLPFMMLLNLNGVRRWSISHATHIWSDTYCSWRRTPPQSTYSLVSNQISVTWKCSGTNSQVGSLIINWSSSWRCCLSSHRVIIPEDYSVKYHSNVCVIVEDRLLALVFVS